MSDDLTGPIKRITSQDRVIAFEAQSNNVYNKFSPYDSSGAGTRFGFQQPYVWTSISDSSIERNLTKYDTQTIPIGSTVRDVERITKFLASGTGLLYIAEQTLLQNQNVFNETKTYNPLSVIAAAASPGSMGLIDRPKRFIETTGTAGDMAASALLSLVAIESKTAEGQPPAGAADGNTISNQAGITIGAKKGLVRFSTGKSAIGRFETMWASPATPTAGGLMQKLASSLINKLASTIVNTVP